MIRQSLLGGQLKIAHLFYFVALDFPAFGFRIPRDGRMAVIWDDKTVEQNHHSEVSAMELTD